MINLIQIPRRRGPSHLGDTIAILEDELDNLDRAGQRKLERIIEQLLKIEEGNA